MKRLFTYILSISLCLSCLFNPTPASAKTCGDLYYTVNNGEVTITRCKEYASGVLNIPKTIEGCPVTSIGESAFANCEELTSVTIPDTVTSIGKNAFDCCYSLTSVNIPDGVTVIEDFAFAFCMELTSIKIPNGVTSIGTDAFARVPISTLTLPKSLTTICDSAFWSCEALTSVNIPEGVTTIGEYAFSQCNSLASVTVPASAVNIGVGAFSGESLSFIKVSKNNPNYCNDARGVLFNKSKTTLIKAPETIRGTYTIPQSVTTLGFSAFSQCTKLTEIVIPEGVTTIENAVFFDCTGLTGIHLPDSVTYIGAYAFMDCDFASIVIPSGVTYLGGSAFRFCNKLKSIYFCGDAPYIGANMVYGNASFDDNIAYAYDHTGNSGWTSDVTHNYGGVLRWKGLEHFFLEYISDQNYTCTEDGTKRAICADCGAVDVQLDAGSAAHRYENGVCAHCGICEFGGDVNGDGKMNIGDVARIYAHVKGASVIVDDDTLICADITGDGTVNIGDVARLYGYIRSNL